MKKVRFQNPMMISEAECHSPTPFNGVQNKIEAPMIYEVFATPVQFSNDPVERFESSDNTPKPSVYINKTKSIEDTHCNPSSELDLSMLDDSNCEPRKILHHKNVFPSQECFKGNIDTSIQKNDILTPIENRQIVNKAKPTDVKPNHDFFLKRTEFDGINIQKLAPKQFLRKSFEKENSPLAKKLETLPIGAQDYSPKEVVTDTKSCTCYDCSKAILKCLSCYKQDVKKNTCHCFKQCGCMNLYQRNCCRKVVQDHDKPLCFCNSTSITPQSQNLVDKKKWLVEKYSNNQGSPSLGEEKQIDLKKDKKEPTVSDLINIIRLQNEQIQLLQEKVDKIISINNSSGQTSPKPIENTVTEKLSFKETSENKISIGVMTSFEMLRTSTIINKEVIKTNENAQVQCNRSQISIKEVISRAQPTNINFLDGLSPTGKASNENIKNIQGAATKGQNNVQADEKTLNEQSLCNVQMDSITPIMSPDQTLYLDVRDYSDSDSDSNQSNVGWTYYNKVMKHVNGMLNMPTTVSSLQRTTKNLQQGQYVHQMQIDKTNVSITKRVKFGDEPLMRQQNFCGTTTDTSLKMNQLAAKYLNGSPVNHGQLVVTRPAAASTDMSFATKEYMARHQLLKNSAAPVSSSDTIPRFLDITNLKKQPKFI